MPSGGPRAPEGTLVENEDYAAALVRFAADGSWHKVPAVPGTTAARRG